MDARRVFRRNSRNSKNGTCVVIPVQDQLFGTSELNESIPEKEDILNVNTIKQLDLLQLSSTRNFLARNIILIPPFMVNRLSIIIQESRCNRKKVLLEAVKYINQFDNKMEQIKETIENAMDSCQDSLSWLFLAMKNKVYSDPMIAYSDVVIQLHFKKLEKMHLNTISNEVVIATNNLASTESHDIQKPLEIIANSSSITRDYLDKLTQMQANNGEKSTESFCKKAKKYQNMI